MDAMILAAGLGTRLGAIGAATPKILIEVDGQPLLARHLDYLHAAGVRRAVVNLHHLGDQVQVWAASYSGPVEVVCVHEQQLLGTSGGVRNALELFEPGPIVVLYGDIVVRDPLLPIVELHERSGAAATITVHDAQSTLGKGVVEVDSDWFVTGFAEKQGASTGPALINSGLYIVESEVVARLEPGFGDFGEDVFPRLIDEGEGIVAYHLSVPVIDIGTPEGMELAGATVVDDDRQFLSSQRKEIAPPTRPPPAQR